MFLTSYTRKTKQPKDQLVKRIRHCRRLEAFFHEGDDAQEGFLMCSPTVATESWSILSRNERNVWIPIAMECVFWEHPHGNHFLFWNQKWGSSYRFNRCSSKLSQFNAMIPRLQSLSNLPRRLVVVMRFPPIAPKF